MKKVALHNLGCKVNAYETEAMGQLLRAAGYELVPFDTGADIYIINTCTVTNIADRKSRQMLHRAKKLNPKAIVVAVGCYVQTAGEKIQEDDSIDLIIGNNKKKDLISILEAYEEGHKAEALIDINHTKEYESLSVTEQAEHTRAYVKVQDGCNQFCSYCIIPYARGRVRSREAEDICSEVEKLAAGGYQEVVLTGIHLSSYGVDLERENLLSLIRAVHQVPGIWRIRLGSLEPRIITEEFAKAIGELPKLCPHFHLSLQSGSDGVLKRMNRHYTTAEYEKACQILRCVFEEPALTTDVIVGFPGETEEEFLETEAFLQKIAFFQTHIFKYSRREGTKAAAMEGQIREAVKGERSKALLKLNEEHEVQYLKKQTGRQVEILVEEYLEINGVSYQTGHTREYCRAVFVSDRDLTGQIVSALGIKALENEFLLCKLL
jgi:threonylcarbamoyladenosine tRNA methylthiotransferase MtaB